MTIDTVDLQTTQQLQKTAPKKAKNQAFENARVCKFHLAGLKPSKILGEGNFNVFNNNDVAVDKNTPSCSTPQTRLKRATSARTYGRYAVADLPAAALASALLHVLSHCSRALLIKFLENCDMPDGSELPTDCFKFT
ncbi:hypothetical protein AVEN_84244-1 [Araneus ventricosus]|uniref:Uncharacterized protein n=1 Tax=Araneus ventricosus TaxID=182803 RepID=A0A4Y2L2C5_ARAVE|nr:hypothetical protein AVEN_84244-1 [Araneus ventricosus]